MVLILISIMVGLITACASSSPGERPAVPGLTLLPSAANQMPVRTQAIGQPTPTAVETTLTPTQTVPPPASTALIEPTITTTAPAGKPAVALAEVVDVWDTPAHEKDYWSRQTQLMIGERVLVLTEQGDWAQIVAVEQPSHKDPRGYPGWVRLNQLAPGWPQTGQFAIVMVQSSPGRVKPDSSSALLQWLPLDARLPVNQESDGWVQTVLPDGRMAWLRRGDVRLIDDWNKPGSFDRFYDTAQSLVGVPYLWGGSGPNGLDCAGFIYRLYHAYGITLPRDADDQAEVGSEVPIAALKRGDLVFTSEKKDGPVSHVVMAWGNGLVIDADSPKGLTIHPLSSFLQVNTLVGARRYLP